MLNTWTRAVLLLYMANELQGFVPAPAGLRTARTEGFSTCSTGGKIALRVHVHREDSKADLLKLLDFEDVSGKIVGDVSKKIGGAKDVLASKKLEVESDVASKFEGAKHMIEGKKREVESDVVSKFEGAKHMIEGKKREVESDVVSKFEGAKHVIESKKREVESGLGSAAEQMFMRFDAFRNKASEEEGNAQKAFERFDAFLKSSEKPKDK
jgi:hypothetical protein